MDSLHARREVRVHDNEYRDYRLALLLHDVGHYFMSHATEQAVGKYFADKTAGLTGLNHEDVGTKILHHDEEIKAVLEDGDVSPTEIASLMAMDKRSILRNLISSEMDADRLDYMMRSSIATGLPYGAYDRNYLIQSLVRQKDKAREDRICLEAKALRAADHYLLCRTFDYLQVIFNKAVVGFEEMLKQCVVYALSKEWLKLSTADVTEYISNNSWKDLDDASMLETIKRVASDCDEPLFKSMAKRIVNRQAAPCLLSYEKIVKRIDHRSEHFAMETKVFLQEKLQEADVLRENCVAWAHTFRPSKYAGTDTPDELETVIHIEGPKHCRALMEHRNSLFSVLARQQFEMVRVYYVGEPGREAEAKRLLMRKCRGKEFDGRSGCWRKK